MTISRASSDRDEFFVMLIVSRRFLGYWKM
jgi:hypothetical protein